MTLKTEIDARDWLTGLGEWDDAAGARLEKLAMMLAEENQRQNLVSVSSLEAVWLRHIVDSAQLLSHVSRETSSPWLDLGTGAGFPGLVIAALRPEIELVMVESRGRRAEWLERARAAMGLTNASVIGLTLEKVPTRPFRVISARAFAPLPKLLALSARFSTATTTWLLPKGRSARQELLDLTQWKHMFHVEQSLSDADAGVIVGTLAAQKGIKA
ncbi:MAG: 16S rRNA (guanine(527)-N(7))-methyltransferase RsmG [Novosphingobium sp.]|uniref:16S rRNA (guanine(527)-N(7))-methyltransferase RsmG n=1 Tax=Novosphingobium sp. TaxID=1874826 RepID=UPI003C7D91FE